MIFNALYAKKNRRATAVVTLTLLALSTIWWLNYDYSRTTKSGLYETINVIWALVGSISLMVFNGLILDMWMKRKKSE
jgi:hypothetical protein